MARVGQTVFAKPALKFVAKKVSEGSGDARKALEMASTAANICRDRTEDFATSTGCLVQMSDVVKASKQSDGIATIERVSALPPMMLSLLLILNELATVGLHSMSILKAKKWSSECLREAGKGDECLSISDFLLTLEMTVDMGLLRAHREGRPSTLNFSNRTTSEVMNEQLSLRNPLEEVIKAINNTTENQAFFKKVSHHASLIAKEELSNPS